MESILSLKEQIEKDVKVAMLARDKALVSTLKGVKSAILYAEVAKGARETGLSDAEIINILAKESKKRQESADLYTQGGNQERARVELAEKDIIDGYLPERLSQEALESIIGEVIEAQGANGQLAMGSVIGAVKQRTSGAADGALIAKLVKERLNG